MTQAIGSGDPKNLQLISDELLQKKIDLCKKLLELFRILAAGNDSNKLQGKSYNHVFWLFLAESRCLGALHFELHAAEAELGRRAMQNKDNCFRKAIENSLQNAEETVRYLTHEPVQLSEGQICAQTKANIESIKLILASTAAPDIWSIRIFRLRYVMVANLK